MTLKTDRRNRRRQWAAALAVLLTATFAAGPALADHQRNRRHDRHDGYGQRHNGHDDHRRHNKRRHHRRKAYRHHRGYPVYAHNSYSRGHYRHSEPAYYCGPCNQRFSDYDALSGHVHRVHHIPIWRLPFVIVDSVLGNVFGFIFHG